MKLFDEIKPVFFIDNKMNDILNDINVKLKKINVNEQLGHGITKIMAIAENYPELKANENFAKLSADLTKIEDEIANSRKYYNGTVKNYNIAVLQFPNNIIASMFNFKKADYFEAGEEAKTAPKVSF